MSDAVKTWSSSVLAALAWGVTVALVYNMLSGTFETRTCQTACVQALYWSALALAVAGALVAVPVAWRKRGAATVLPALALVVLLGVLGTTLVIGVLRTTFAF